MSFWQQLQTAAGIGATFPWVVLVFLAAALALFVLRPTERMRIRTALLLFALSLIGLMVAAALLSYGVPQTNSSYKWVRWASRFLQWIALVNVAGVFVFEVLGEFLQLFLLMHE